MKRKFTGILSMLMVFTMVLTGCGKKPAETYKGELDKVVLFASEGAGKVYSNIPGVSKDDKGFDISLDVIATDSDGVIKGDYSSIGAELELDFVGENTQAVINLNLDKKPFTSGKAILGGDKLYFTLTDFTSEYLGLNIEKTGVELSKLPSSDEIKSMVKDYGTRLVTAFQYESVDKKTNIDVDGIFFKATKFTGVANTDELKTITDGIAKDFKESSLYKALGNAVGEKSEQIGEKFNELTSEDNKTVKLNVYIGKDKNVAYEFEKEDNSKLGYITNGTNWTLYTIESDKEVALAYHKVEADGKNGKLFMGDKESSVEVIYTNAVKDKDNKITSCNFIVRTTEDGISSDTLAGSYKDEGKKVISIEIKEDGTKIADLELSISSREAKAFEVPTEYYDANSELLSWMGTINEDKISEFGDKFNEITQLINSFSFKDRKNDAVSPNAGVDTSNAGGDDTKALEDFEVVREGQAKPLEEFKGYNPNSYDVWFEPSEEEVLEAGEPSTGVRTLVISDEQIKNVEDYLARESFIKDARVTDDKSYVIMGTEGDLKSYYTRTVTYFADEENFISVGYEAITGKLSSIMVRTSDKERCLELTQSLYDCATGNASEEKLIDNYKNGAYNIYDASSGVNVIVLEGENYNETKYYTGVIG